MTENHNPETGSNPCADLLASKGFPAYADAFRDVCNAGLYVIRRSDYWNYRLSDFGDSKSIWDVVQPKQWQRAFFSRESAVAVAEQTTVEILRRVSAESKEGRREIEDFLTSTESNLSEINVEQELKRIFNKEIGFDFGTRYSGQAFSQKVIHTGTTDDQILQTLELFGAELFVVEQVPIHAGDME